MIKILDLNIGKNIDNRKIQSMKDPKQLIRKPKIYFPSIDTEVLFEDKKAVLIDIDDTLYPYWPSHIHALKQVLRYLRLKLPRLFKKMDIFEFEANYQKYRKVIIKRLFPNGMCRNRYLLFVLWMEELGVEQGYLLARRLEKIYWNSFIKSMKVDKKALGFFKECKKKGIKVVAITDMQADVQIRKIQKLRLTPYLSFLVTSDEAGIEKPDAKIFQMALDKLGLKGTQVVMIGDNQEKDLDGAAQLGIRGYKVD